MRLAARLLPGALLLDLKVFRDGRGVFAKTYQQSIAETLGIAFPLVEEFYSISAKGVVRGMHFQVPPRDHRKLVYCAAGSVLDVLLDLRPGAGYGQVASTVLQAQRPQCLLIPSGVAHGFLSLTDDSLMIYKTTTEHSPDHDCGVLWSSFAFEWPEPRPIVSDRDAAHPPLADFVSPF